MASVIGPTDEAVQGCEAHAAQALDAIAGARITPGRRLGGRPASAVAAPRTTGTKTER